MNLVTALMYATHITSIICISVWQNMQGRGMQAAIDIIMAANRPSKAVSRQRSVFRRLLGELGDPQDACKSIHITGTNGKGSVALKAAYVLEKAGYKTGLYTSPHLFSFLERIRVNRNNIEAEMFCDHVFRIEDMVKRHSLEVTFFEYLTAAGFMHFKEVGCDFSVIEVGLGGREDTTNVIKPELSVITTVALDHQRILGNTRELIAKDKAGIIKENTPVVIGPHAKLQPVIDEASQKNAPLHVAEVKQEADFEEENKQIVRKCMQILKGKGFNIGENSIEGGLLARQRCRMEQLPPNLLPRWSGGKRVFFDVCHNPNAVANMLKYYRNSIRTDNSKLTVLFGTSKEKDAGECLKLIEQEADMIMLIAAKHYRGMPVEEVSTYVGDSRYPGKFRYIDDGAIDKSLSLAMAEKQREHVIVCGSFFIMQEAWGFFDPSYLHSETNFQENYFLHNQNQKVQKQQK